MKMVKHLRLYIVCVATIAVIACDPPRNNGSSAGNSPAPSPASGVQAAEPHPENAGPKSWCSAPSDSSFKFDEDLIRRNFYVVLDGSGSMNESPRCAGNERKTVIAKNAVKEFARKIPANDNLGLLVFDGGGPYGTERVPLGINNRDEFNRKVDQSDTQAGTPLRSAITAAYENVKKQAQRQRGYGEYYLIIVTDGEANNGEEPDGIVNQILTESPVVIHTIGFCIGNRHSLNQPGRTVYKDAQSPQDVARGLEAVLAE